VSIIRRMRPHGETISVGGTHVHTWVGGQGDPLLVLHGAGGYVGWRKWMERVAEHSTVWAPTHPGFGASGDAEWMEDVDDLARFYLWWIDAARLGRPHVLLEAQESRIDHATTMRSIELMGATVIPAIAQI